MKTVIGLVAGLLLGGVGGWYLSEDPGSDPAEDISPEEIAQIEAEIVEVWEDHFRVMETFDCDRLTKTLHPEHLAMAYGARLVGFDDWDGVCTGFFTTMESWTGYWADTEVRVLTPDLAVFTGYYGDTIHYSNGEVVTWPGNCAQVSLMERTEDGWKNSLFGQSCGSSQPVDGS